MIFTNITFFTLSIFIILFLVCLYFIFLIYTLTKSKVEVIFLFFTLLFLLIAIFEPKSWLKNTTNISSWANIVFLLDVSKSMNAIDYNAWWGDISRLDFSKNFIQDIITKNKNNNYWLNIFSWEALEVLPLTSDKAIFSTILSWITSDNISANWTNINAALISSVWFFNDENWWLIIMLSDWHDEEELWKLDQIKKDLKNKNIDIVILWIGTLWWAYIPIWIDMFWNYNYKIYNWRKVVSKLNEKALKKLSSQLNWKYFRVEDIDSLKKIDNYIDSNIEKITIESELISRKNLERYFVFVSFLFFFLYLLLPIFNIWKRD